MSIKDILVFLDDGVSNTDRIQTSIQLSKSHGAHITGASLASLKPIHAKSDNQEVIMRMSDTQAHKLADDFIQIGSNNGLEVDSVVISGDANNSAMKMAHYARNSDIVVLGQPDPSKDNFLRLQEFAQEVMLHSGRPILFIPYIGIKNQDYNYNKAMIARDGTPAASRAVHDAMPLLSNTDEVIILVVESKKQKEFKKDLLVKGLVKHLANHDINSSFLSIDPKKSNVPAVILNEIADNNIDLLVIGGYGTPTLKQKVFGSVSSTLLSSMVVPVLMSH